MMKESVMGKLLKSLLVLVAAGFLLTVARPAPAQDSFHFSTGNPDGKIGTASRPDSPGKIEIESADDFILNFDTAITHATFTGLLPAGVTLSSIGNVRVEIYRVFPNDSTNPPSGNVPTRVNSPSDDAFVIRDAASGSLTFTAVLISPTFLVANTVVNGINKSPNQTTGGEGPATGQEVLFDVIFSPALLLPADHYFFVPQVQLPGASDNFLWLSAPKPIIAPGTPFTPDLQSWIRNANLDPDWLRIGTDVVGGNPPPTFNATFSLDGTNIAQAFQVNYFAGANGARPDQTVRITNTGTATDPAGSTTSDLCANIYVFRNDQQLAECCSCLVTPNGLRTLSVDFDLAHNALTPGTIGEGVIKIISSQVPTGGCTPALAGSAYASLPGLLAWGTHNQDVSGGLQGAGVVNAVTETPFSPATLSQAELKGLQNNCAFIRNQGSGHGICLCGRGD